MNGDGGWIKVWRKTLESAVWKDPDVFRVWMWCLMRAAHEETQALIGKQKVVLMPGQLISKRALVAEETGLSEKKVRNSLLALLDMGNLGQQTTNKFTILSVINWDAYQCKPDDLGQQRANKGPTKGQQRANKQLSTLVLEEEKKRRREDGGLPFGPDLAADVPASPETSRPAAFKILPTKDGPFEVTKNRVEELEEIYPGVNVKAQIHLMEAWLTEKPSNLKTLRGINTFMLKWLDRAKSQAAEFQKQPESMAFRPCS